MRLFPRPGRLFWKLVLALFLSMALSMIATFTYVAFVSGPAPVPPQGALMVGPVPAVPLLAGLIAIFVIGLLFAWYLSRPLHQLSWALHRIAQGNFETRVSPLMGRKWGDEIVDLGQDFDRMAERLQRAVESQRSLLHDVSHELRSPLTRMQAAIGLLRQSPESSEAMIARIETESEKLDALIEELLTLHRLDAGAVESQHERVDLVELLQAIVEDAEFEASASGKTIALDTGEPFISEVQGELVYRAFENVIRNAVKYSPVGAATEVRAQVTQDDWLEVSVADRGPGVPSELHKRIFDPFFRIEERGHTGGTGLGLAIAHRTITSHGGDIHVALRERGGLVVTISLPRRLGP
ncbi:HAMP domain-containing protein [Azoarcus communis]|uniref:HAMP domain-containing sensor histidine kinase n=1 Tax=Parazoarcus communis TaxID=41977 RepID=UPI001459BE68|nr:ATP-binding protein [Parazoarcus communis]NMG49059.1 HAMP domain-containing protein [Parazoarcus communis]